MNVLSRLSFVIVSFEHLDLESVIGALVEVEERST